MLRSKGSQRWIPELRFGYPPVRNFSKSFWEKLGIFSRKFRGLSALALGGSQKGGFQKGGFQKARYQNPERGYIRMFPDTENRNEGTCRCSPVPKKRAHIRQNRPTLWFLLEVLYKNPAIINKKGVTRGAVFTRTFLNSSRERLPSSLWHESGTQQKLLRKTCSDELFYFRWSFSDGVFLLCVPL